MKKPLLITGLVVLGIALIGILLSHGNALRSNKGSFSGTGNVEAAGAKRKGAGSAAVASEAGVPSLSKLPDRAMTKAEIAALLDQAEEALRSGDPDTVKLALARLDEVFTGPHHNDTASIAAILEFLKTGRDTVTGEAFIVGAGGVLAEATTLRVFLMDRLGSLSREARSNAALDVARENLRQPDSADEWAISMRNVAWFDPDSREFLAGRVSAMLSHEPWRQNPSQGMQEAFDLIVHTGALSLVPELERIFFSADSPLGRAASVALDRLAATRPLELTTMLNQKPELFAAVPLQRADLFAHADLGDPAQRQQAETYLGRTDVSAAEREKFLSSLLQIGQFVSHNLTTPYTAPESPAAAGARLEVLSQTLTDWLKDDRFTGFQNELALLGAAINQIDDEINADATQ